MDDTDREDRLYRLVERFYEKGRVDPLLGPIFQSAIHDWPGHFRIVADFWSHALFGTQRYRGHPFPVHMNLAFPPEAFDRWLELFAESTAETLLPMEAEMAMARAQHMTKSFRVGLFPFTGADGRPSRTMPQ